MTDVVYEKLRHGDILLKGDRDEAYTIVLFIDGEWYHSHVSKLTGNLRVTDGQRTARPEAWFAADHTKVVGNVFDALVRAVNDVEVEDD